MRLTLLLKPFWNRKERRLRSLWRILIHGLLFVFLAGLLTFGVSFAVPILTESGDPAGNSLDPALDTTGLLMDGETMVYQTLLQAAFLGGSLLALWFAGKFLDRRQFANFGFHINRRWWLDLGFGLSLGAFLMVVIFLVELAAGWVTVVGTLLSPGPAFWTAISFALLTFIMVGIQEEIISRGYHLRNLAEGFNGPRIGARTALLIGYLISSFMFGLFHIANANASLISTFNIAIAGLFLGLGFILTKELAIPIGIHITWNFFQGNVFGFPVSGMQSTTTFIAIQQGGPEIWTGGVFGPEAGIIGLLAMALGSLLIWLWVKRTSGQAELQTELAQYSSPGHNIRT